MLRGVTLLAGASVLSGCAFSQPANVLTVEEVIQDISSGDSRLDGKSVAIGGFLGSCGGNDCGLYSSKKDARIVEYGNASSQEWSEAMDRRLSIAADDDFDRTAFFMQSSEVIVRGKVNATWHAPPDESGTQFGCLDRCDDITPVSIQKVMF